jgi:hypothetical protein
MRFVAKQFIAVAREGRKNGNELPDYERDGLPAADRDRIIRGV